MPNHRPFFFAVALTQVPDAYWHPYINMPAGAFQIKGGTLSHGKGNSNLGAFYQGQEGTWGPCGKERTGRKSMADAADNRGGTRMGGILLGFKWGQHFLKKFAAGPEQGGFSIKWGAGHGSGKIRARAGGMAGAGGAYAGTVIAPIQNAGGTGNCAGGGVGGGRKGNNL